MRHFRIGLVASALLALVAPREANAQWREPDRTLPAHPSSCTVARVIDGDTLQCTDGRRIRLRGIDAPERGERGHRAATEALRRRVEGRSVTVTPHHMNRGRIVADVTVEGRNVGQELDRLGHSKRRGARR